ncbi:hypothetical protein FQZ97_915580 [compost metagenome]
MQVRLLSERGHPVGGCGPGPQRFAFSIVVGLRFGERAGLLGQVVLGDRLHLCLRFARLRVQPAEKFGQVVDVGQCGQRGQRRQVVIGVQPLGTQLLAALLVVTKLACAHVAGQRLAHHVRKDGAPVAQEFLGHQVAVAQRVDRPALRIEPEPQHGFVVRHRPRRVFRTLQCGHDQLDVGGIVLDDRKHAVPEKRDPLQMREEPGRGQPHRHFAQVAAAGGMPHEAARPPARKVPPKDRVLRVHVPEFVARAGRHLLPAFPALVGGCCIETAPVNVLRKAREVVLQPLLAILGAHQ